MSTERIDVLAVIDAEIAFIREGIGRGDEMVHLEMTRHERVKVAEIRAALMERLARTQDARDAVVELVEADKEFDDARRAFYAAKADPAWHGHLHNHVATDRYLKAEQRRAAALARVQGEGA